MRFFKMATLLKNYRTSLNNCFKIMGKTGGALLQGGHLINGGAHEVFLSTNCNFVSVKSNINSLSFAKTVVQ